MRLMHTARRPGDRPLADSAVLTLPTNLANQPSRYKYHPCDDTL